jgi:dephospho-CoA kinase
VKTKTSPAFPIYGLTGGIASGKSVVAGFLRELGIEVVDADAIARDLRAPGGPAEGPILSEFGTLDPKELRARIANDGEAKRKLESILHPLISAESERRFSAIANRASPGGFIGAKYAVYEAALLVEAGRAKDFSGLILVESDPDLQLARLVARDGMEPEIARRFLRAQAPTSVKRAAATHRLLNNGTREELRSKVASLHAALVRGEKSFSA